MTTHSSRWLLYGAYGYTGTLIAREAARRGHRPVLAGRDAARLVPLAEELGLPHAIVDLDVPAALSRALDGIPLVLHAAGPFVRTSPPMLRACLDAGASYLDITGEIPVFESIFEHDGEARARGVALLPGVGFDVVPTDCLAAYVAARVPGATELEIAIAPSGQSSAGTFASALEQLPRGGFARRGGALESVPLGQGARRVRFLRGERTVLPIPWGDLATAWRTTGIPNITTYMAFSRRVAELIGTAAPFLQRVLSFRPALRAAQAVVARTVRGPSDAAAATHRSDVWARATDLRGHEAQAWLECDEGYRFTARSAVRCVERTLAERPVGAITPAGAFGADFVLEIEGTRRLDALPS